MLKGLIASAISVVGVIYAHFIWDIVTPVNCYMTGTFLIGFIALIGINSKNSLLIMTMTAGFFLILIYVLQQEKPSQSLDQVEVAKQH